MPMWPPPVRRQVGASLSEDSSHLNSTLSLRHGLPLNLEPTETALGCLVSKAQVSPASSFPALGSQAPAHLASYVGAGIWTQVLTLVPWALYPLSHLPSPSHLTARNISNGNYSVSQTPFIQNLTLLTPFLLTDGNIYVLFCCFHAALPDGRWHWPGSFCLQHHRPAARCFSHKLWVPSANGWSGCFSILQKLQRDSFRWQPNFICSSTRVPNGLLTEIIVMNPSWLQEPDSWVCKNSDDDDYTKWPQLAGTPKGYEV